MQVAEVVRNYIAGLHWVMEYYYRGVPSWEWFYPYHYAPFLSDMKALNSINITFTLSEPVLPFHQVRAVCSHQGHGGNTIIGHVAVTVEERRRMLGT